MRLRRRWCGLTAAIVLLSGCGSFDPGAGAEPGRTEQEKLQHWMSKWAEEADTWSMAWVDFLDGISASDDGLTRGQVHGWADSLHDAATALQAAVRRAGPLDSTYSLTYPAGLAAGINSTVSSARALGACAQTCQADLDEMVTVGGVLELLVVKTAAVRLTPALVMRTVEPNDALPSVRVDGRIPLGDRIDPAEYLCTPSFEDGDVLAEHATDATSARVAFVTADRVPVFVQVLGWDRSQAAAEYFEILEVRAITCPLESSDSGRLEEAWSLEVSDPLAVHAVGWGGEHGIEGNRTLYSHGLAALVDDAVVSVLAFSTDDQARSEVAQNVLRETIAGLGVDPKPTR